MKAKLTALISIAALVLTSVLAGCASSGGEAPATPAPTADSGVARTETLPPSESTTAPTSRPMTTDEIIEYRNDGFLVDEIGEPGCYLMINGRYYTLAAPSRIYGTSTTNVKAEMFNVGDAVPDEFRLDMPYDMPIVKSTDDVRFIVKDYEMPHESNTLYFYNAVHYAYGNTDLINKSSLPEFAKLSDNAVADGYFNMFTTRTPSEEITYSVQEGMSYNSVSVVSDTEVFVWAAPFLQSAGNFTMTDKGYIEYALPESMPSGIYHSIAEVYNSYNGDFYYVQDDKSLNDFYAVDFPVHVNQIITAEKAALDLNFVTYLPQGAIVYQTYDAVYAPADYVEKVMTGKTLTLPLNVAVSQTNFPMVFDSFVIDGQRYYKVKLPYSGSSFGEPVLMTWEDLSPAYDPAFVESARAKDDYHNTKLNLSKDELFGN